MSLERKATLTMESRAPITDSAHDVLKQERHALDAIFSPRTVAVIGATETTGSVGRTVLWNLLSNPFGGTVFPVNPKRAAVLGIKAYPNIASVPAQVDLAVIVTPAPAVPALVAECAAAHVKGIIIISAGFNVYPRLVEEAIYLHPAVCEAVVAGIQDANRGQIVKAWVKLHDGAALTQGELKQFLRDKLAPVEIPKRIEFRDELPRTPIGKLSRKALVEEELAKASKLWDGQVVNLQVVDSSERALQLRCLVSARTSPEAWDLRCEMREKLIAFLQDEYPGALPKQRAELVEIDRMTAGAA